MRQIKLLDCTLSAGGEIIDWDFGEENIKNYLDIMKSDVADILEVGLLKPTIYRHPRPIFNNLKKINALISPKNSDIHYSAITDMNDPIPLRELQKKEPCSIDIVRVRMDKINIYNGFSYCEILVKMGYQAYAFLANANNLSENDLQEIVKRAQLTNVTGVIVEDCGFPSETCLKELINYLDEKLPCEMSIGFRAHNAMGMAIQHALLFCDSIAKHDLILETSMVGMGKFDGILRLEYITAYLNLRFGKNYSIKATLQAFDKCIAPIYSRLGWSVCLANYLAELHKCNHEFSIFLSSELGFPSSTVNDMLGQLSDEEKELLSEEQNDRKTMISITKKHLKKSIHLGIVVLTKDRSDCISNLLSNCAWQLRRKNIDLIIYDSSEDDKTQNIVINYQIGGYYNVYYRKYKGEFDGFSIDQKVTDALRRYSSKYEYVWLLRDSIIPTMGDWYDQLEELMEEKCDCIIVDAASRNNNKNQLKKYKCSRDCKEFFCKNVARSTVLGATILSAKMATLLVNDYPINDSNYGFWMSVVPYHYLASHNASVALLIDAVFTGNPVGAPKNSLWKTKDNALKQWAECWPAVIRALPSVYDSEKEKAMKIHTVDFHLFNILSLIWLRGNNNLSTEIVRRYEGGLPFVTETGLRKIYIISSLPKSFAKFIVKHQYRPLFQKAFRVYGKLFVKEKSNLAHED